DLNTGQEKLRLRPPLPASKLTGRRTFAALVFTRDGKSLVTSGSGDELIQWDLASGKEQRRLGQDLTNCSALAISPDGQTLAAGMNTISMFDFVSGRRLLPAGGNSPRGLAASFSKDGEWFATTGPMGDMGRTRVTYWDPSTGKELRHVEVPDGFVLNFA